MMNAVSNFTDMVAQFLGERQGFANQTSDSLAQGVIKSLNMTCFFSFLAHCSMSFAG
jgi:hypothetical protein